jgi:hypothetical protein
MKKAFLFLVDYAKQNNISFEDAARRYLQSNGVYQSAVKDYILRAGRIPNVGILEQAKQAGYLILENGGDYLENFLNLEPGEIPTLYRRFNFYGFANEFPVVFVACVILAGTNNEKSFSNFLFESSEQTERRKKAQKQLQNWTNEKLDQAKDVLGSVADVTKKVALAPFRGPFLLLVRFNVFNLARRLDRGLQKDRQRLKNLWEDEIGGDFVQLTKTVEQGKKESPILPGKSQTFGLNYSSLDPVTLTANIAAASVITAKVTAALAAIGVVVDQALELKDKGKDLLDKDKPKDQPTPTGATPPIVPSETPGQAEKPKNNTTMLLLVGGALVAAYLIYKKKI